MSNRPLAEAFSTGASWLSRALSVSVVLHVLVALVWWVATDRETSRDVELVDIELAPPPPEVEALQPEVARPPESAPAAQTPAATTPEQPAQPPLDEDAVALHDAGVDAPADAAVDASAKRPRPDAGVDGGIDGGIDGGMDAGVPLVAATGLEQMPGDDAGAFAQLAGDAGVPLEGDAGAIVAATESGSGVGSGVGLGSGEGLGVAAATQVGSGSGAPGMDNQPAVDGAPTTAGTAANLLAYFPPGHQVTAMIRFDRLRNTEWAIQAERLLKPMPDYRVLFGARDADVAAKLDTLVISTPRPRDATATTLVVHSTLTRPALRRLLASPDTPITWTVTRGGMYGRRTGKLFPTDKRVLLSPWRDWLVLAPPADLPGLLTPAKGRIDTVETKAKLPPWLQTIRTIEQESGTEKQRGPALVLTLAGPGQRYDIPDIGLGITSLPSPERITAAMELVKQGWLIRGNIVFGNEADAAELAKALQEVQQRIVDSRVLSALLRRQHALNVVKNLSIARTGARVSYATSMSIADARAIMAAAAATLDVYFAAQPQPPP